MVDNSYRFEAIMVTPAARINTAATINRESRNPETSKVWSVSVIALPVQAF
jgi:hypothetical protein